MPNKDPLPTPNADTPRGPTPTPKLRGRQKKPPPRPTQDPADTENPEGQPLNPALLPICDPAGAA